MIISEIYIENKRLDVTADISALLTFALDDIKDFSSRATTFSKTIVLPGTNNNNFLFGHIFDARVSNPYNSALPNVATNYNAAIGAQCLIFMDHIQVFKGTMRLSKMIIDNGVPEYECEVFGELNGLVGAIGSDKLEDLDFSEYNHVYNPTNIQNSWDAAPGSGYYYPLIDYGGVSTNKIDFSIKAFRPALYVKEYIDKMFAAAGYTYESSLFDTTRFKRLIIPHNQKDLRFQTSQLVNASGTTGYTVISSGTTAEDRLEWPFFSGNGFSIDGTNKRITYTDANPINVQFQFNIDGTYSNDAVNIELVVRKNGSTFLGVGNQLLDDNGGVTDPYEWNRAADVTFNNGDYIEFFFVKTGLTRPFQVDVDNWTMSITTLYPVWVPVDNGDDLTINDTIPRNILQKDFLASIVRLFNLYIFEDVGKSKHLRIEPYVDFYDTNVSGITDWTYKVDRSKKIELEPMSQLNSRYYEFKFKSDNDYYNELYRKKYNKNYGDRIYDSAFQFTNEKTEVSLIFSPSVLYGATGTDKVYPAFYKLTNLTTEEPIDVNLRILQSKKVTSVNTWDIEDGFGGALVSNLTVYGYAGHYDDPDSPGNDIHFGVPDELYFTLVSGAVNVTQFNVYWSPYMAEITDKDSKLLRCHVKLTARDIYDLDFSKFIYIDGSIWRLYKITDWNASNPDVCQCEFLKVINMIY